VIGIVVKPNPPIAGQPLEVEYIGPGDVVYWHVDDGPLQEVSVPPRKFTIPAVPRGRDLLITDGKGNGDVFPIDDIS
jgi:hypothetical protein